MHRREPPQSPNTRPSDPLDMAKDVIAHMTSDSGIAVCNDNCGGRGESNRGDGGIGEDLVPLATLKG